MNEHEQINGFLVGIWRRIEKIEERALTAGLEDDISLTEIHIIEKIGLFADCRMSEIAKAIGITLATLTVACDKLENKDLIIRTRDAKDKRAVRINLTAKGAAVYEFHKRFHERMVTAAISELDDDESKVLAKALNKLQVFFENLN